jgi:transcriptional regulator with GAF, ATPase, and Fis domain
VRASWGPDETHQRAIVRRFIESGYKFDYLEQEVLTPGRGFRWFLNLASGEVVNGRLERVWGSTIETTDRKRAELELTWLKEALEQERDYLRDEVRKAGAFGEIIGESAALRRALEQVEAVAPTPATVLITGESGVGKELFARAIHDRSPRASRPLIRVNCASIPRDLFESEFFGHVRGAFTGALKDRQGRFNLAERGTLFLDEVGEIPLASQAKLLRVLQEREFERVGDDRTQRVDVRVIAGSNRDLRQEAAQGRFREDLYFRLAAFPVHVPPLRERREDVPALATHFLNRAVMELNVRGPHLPDAEIERLQAYDWPGNVRELQNLVERALILSRGGPMRFADLLPSATGAPTATSAVRTRGAPPDRSEIEAALLRHGGNVSRVARELEVARPTLYRRMRDLGLR